MLIIGVKLPPLLRGGFEEGSLIYNFLCYSI
jgi:hypothetical protein